MGPLDRLFGNGPFDLNHDGEIDANETSYINDIIFNDEEDISDDSAVMDEYDRRSAIEDAESDI